ncbi:unnamed protein product [Cunninghamella echinulata]
MYQGKIGPSTRSLPPIHIIQVLSKDGVPLNGDDEVQASIYYKDIEEWKRIEGERPYEFGEEISFDIDPDGRAINIKRSEEN